MPPDGGSSAMDQLPITWLLNRFRLGDASSHEFVDKTGRTGFTAPQPIPVSRRIGIGQLVSDR
jgi:hypothetical protein